MFKVYICDPEKNTECKKTNCQITCFSTLNPKYGRDYRVMRNEEMLKFIRQKLNERKISIPIDRDFTEDYKVGWKDGIFWEDILDLFEELEVDA